MKRWIHASSSATSSLIPDSCKQYYKIDNSVDAEEIDELTDSFESFNLEFVAPLVAKSRYESALSAGEIEYVSLCKDSNGKYGVYSMTSYGPVNITNRVPEILDRVKGVQASESIQAGVGSGRRIEYYIGTYPDRKVFHTDGFQTSGFKTEEEAQASLDEIYKEEYFRNKYPGLQVLSKAAYSVWHD